MSWPYLPKKTVYTFHIRPQKNLIETFTKISQSIVAKWLISCFQM